ncbi:MAG: lipid-A-disaccharide synthase [Lentimicrobiaceae bacterium]|nr:lipid-A-disaccharide synthase [Lentimicrobiaceae bacterium]
MRYYIIAGEASGDLHASNLMAAIKKKDHQADFRYFGGDKMQAQGGVLVKHYRDMAFMGFVEVVLNLTTILKNLQHCKKDISQFKPEVAILVDYPGFNMRMAKYLHKKRIPVVYYISPQIWAWNQSRVHKIRKSVDKMLVILPFEQAFYKQHKVDVEFVGHPLLDELLNIPEVTNHFPADKPTVALLPGSRKQEISLVLPIMLEVAQLMPEVNFVIAGLNAIGEDFYRALASNRPVNLLMNQTYQLLAASEAALVTSGTATLETALIGTPEVVCYKGGTLSYQIAKRVIRTKYISLVNLVMEKPVVKELIQHELTPQNLKSELQILLNNKEKRAAMLNDFALLRKKLGGEGASDKAAEIIVGFLNEKNNHKHNAY